MATTKTRRTASQKTQKKSVPRNAKKSQTRTPSKKSTASKANQTKKIIPATAPAAVKKSVHAALPNAGQSTAPVAATQKKKPSTPPVKTSSSPLSAHKTVLKTPAKVVPVAAPAGEHPKKAHFNKTDLDQFKIDLLAMRDRITGQSGSMRSAALQRTDEVNPEEDGTDAFMRLQTLEQVSSQHQIIANINEALRAIEKGTYGVCDTCGELISKQRLAVLPFAKNCIKCQSEMERPSRSGGRR